MGIREIRGQICSLAFEAEEVLVAAEEELVVCGDWRGDNRFQ